MDPKAITLAKSRLRIVSQTLDELKACTEFEAFSDRWFVFLTAWKGIYTVLEQGAKSSPQSRQWFGSKKAERKGDALLQYLFQARNDEEHGLAVSIVPTHGSQLISIPDAGIEGRQLRVHFNAATGQFGVTRDDGGPISVLQAHGPGPSLQAVVGRGNITYHPPIAHLGGDVDVSPIGVALAGLAYMQALIVEAENLGGPSP